MKRFFLTTLIIALSLSFYAANLELLSNAGFEKYSTASLGGGSGLEGLESGITFEDWAFTSHWYVGVEKKDIKEGQFAFRTNKEMRFNTSLSQSVNVTTFQVGDQFELQVSYKVPTPKQGDSLWLNCAWFSNRDGVLKDDSALLHQGLPVPNAEWQTKTIRINKPATADKLEFQVGISKKTIVILDAFSFHYVEPTTPWFRVSPTAFKPVKANIGESVKVGTVTVQQGNMPEPVKLYITGKYADLYRLTKSQVTQAEETVDIYYEPETVGFHTAYFSAQATNDVEAMKCNTTFSIYGIAIDSTKNPSITVSPKTLPAFACKATKQHKETINVMSENCIEPIHVQLTNQETNGAFRINSTMLAQNMTQHTVVTFAPQSAGKYHATIQWTTYNGEAVTMQVTGTATEEEAPQVDYATTFSWTSEPVYPELNEQFNEAGNYRNKTYPVKDWQNVVRKGTRAWWGYTSLSDANEKCAKVTAYKYGNDSVGEPCEIWLVTPALNYTDAATKTFSFRVQGQGMTKKSIGRLKVYYIDPSSSEPYMEHIATLDTIVPNANPDVNNKWIPIILNLKGIANAPRIFHIGFCLIDNISSNGVTYLLDDVKWNIPMTPLDQVQDNTTREEGHKIMYNGQIYIQRGNKLYNALGIEISVID